MQIYLAVTPDKQREAKHFAGQLARTHGRMMVLGIWRAAPSGTARPCAVTCGGSAANGAPNLVTFLGRVLSRNGKQLFVPDHYGA